MIPFYARSGGRAPLIVRTKRAAEAAQSRFVVRTRLRRRRLLAGLGLAAGTVGCTLGAIVTVDELDHGHGCIVALAEAGLHDPEVAAVTVGVARRDRLEQPLHRGLAADLRDRQAA